MSRDTDPVLKHSRREGIIIAIAWVAATTYCCAYSYFYGYNRDGHKLGVGDLHPVYGIPSWVFYGILVPWLACALFTFWFAGFYMVDDDLGTDHTAELNRDIREGGME
ncbi:hypothetical protein [Singulisphaera sp. PoT]|uniref:hypothetical protein n=1 Tax=Singulisphaera sp. PoT TaxID=3411797 RepID=UPI003BF52EED